MNEKERTKNLKDIKGSLLEKYGDDYHFRHDLRKIMWAIYDRIELIKKVK